MQTLHNIYIHIFTVKVATCSSDIGLEKRYFRIIKPFSLCYCQISLSKSLTVQSSISVMVHLGPGSWSQFIICSPRSLNNNKKVAHLAFASRSYCPAHCWNWYTLPTTNTSELTFTPLTYERNLSILAVRRLFFIH